MMESKTIFVSQFLRQIYINTIPKILYSYFPDSIVYERELLLSLLQDERIQERAEKEFPDFNRFFVYLQSSSPLLQIIQYSNLIIDAQDVKSKDKEIREVVRKLTFFAIKNRKRFGLKKVYENLYFDTQITLLLDFCVLQTDLKDKIPSWEALRNARDQKKMPFTYKDTEFATQKKPLQPNEGT